LKILEAMAAGVPVVSTALGAEGLAAHPGADILIADTPDDWERNLATLAPRDAFWNGLAEQGRVLVNARYDWTLLGNALVRTYREWLAERPGESRGQTAALQ